MVGQNVCLRNVQTSSGHYPASYTKDSLHAARGRVTEAWSLAHTSILYRSYERIQPYPAPCVPSQHLIPPPLAQGIHRLSHGTEAEFCCACSICVTPSTHLLRHAGCYFLQGIKFLTPKQDGFERDFSPGTHSVTWTVTLVLSHGPALTCGNRIPGGDVTKWRRYAS